MTDIKVLYLEKPLDYIDFNKVKEEVEEFERFFQFCFGYPLKSIQRNYAKRFFANMSFSIVAPTGTGKTILGLFLGFYNSFIKNNKTLFIFPTQLLIKQSFEILTKYIQKIEKYRGSKISQDEYIFFLSYDTKDQKENKMDRLSRENYKLVSLTHQFLSRRFDLIESFKFDYIFVDDLDSVSRSSKNTIRILKLLGFSESSINLAKTNDFEVPQALQDEIKDIKDEIGVLVVSSATLKKGINTILFRKLLNFDVGNSINFVRNIDDIFIPKKDINKLRDILREMGPGAIIFTTSREEALLLQREIPNSKFVNSKNIKEIDGLVDIYEEEMVDSDEEDNEYPDELEEIGKIKEGIDYLIGIASPYSILVRGLDLPYKIRYTIFWGLPKRKIDLLNLENYRNTFFIQKFLSNLFFKRRMVSLQKIKEYINEIEQPKLISVFVIKENLLYSIDVKTYLQASGRSSRITPYGITKGVSFIFDDEIFFEPLSKVAKFNNFDIKSFEDISLRELREQIDESRRRDVDPQDFDFKTYLMVVESPTKARQIAQMFGNPGIIRIGNYQAFEVVSPIGILLIAPSLGHVVELSVDEINQKGNIYNVIVDFDDKGIRNVLTLYCSIKKCKDCNKIFASTLDKCIYCSSDNITSSLENVSSLKTLGFFSDGLIVATDPDSEGEKISYDIVNLLNFRDYKRIIFNEITKKAVINALNNPISIRQNLVDAQQVRRIEDRWIGFSLSKIIKEKMEEYNISAGRVQSPVLHWISEKYKEYINKKRFSIVEIEDFVVQFANSDIKGEAELEIQITDEYLQKVNVLPFNTSDILIFANSVLKINSVEAMRILQRLFENGLITYHRTESYYISDYGISISKEIFNRKGWEFNYRNFGEPSTHEAIRITKSLEPEDVRILYQDKLNLQALRLYEMIYRKFLACFTKDNYLKIAKYKLMLKQDGKCIQTEQERVIETFGKAFEIFPYLAYKSKTIQPGKYKVKVKNVKKPITTLYSQADIIKIMREKEIGRPSTYAYTIQKLFSRGYVIEKFNKLIPTKKGLMVDHLLTQNYNEFVNENRTTELLKKIDEIEQGERKPLDVVYELLKEIQNLMIYNRS